MALTTEQKQRFEEDGYLVIRNMLTPEETAALKWRADQIASGEMKHVPEQWVQVEPAIQRGEAEPESRVESISNTPLKLMATDGHIVGFGSITDILQFGTHVVRGVSTTSLR